MIRFVVLSGLSTSRTEPVTIFADALERAKNSSLETRPEGATEVSSKRCKEGVKGRIKQSLPMVVKSPHVLAKRGRDPPFLDGKWRAVHVPPEAIVRVSDMFYLAPGETGSFPTFVALQGARVYPLGLLG